MRAILASIALSSMAATVVADTLDKAQASAKLDLKDALARLAQQREEQQKGKSPLVSEANALEGAARAKRKEFDRRLRLRDNQESSLAELKGEVEELEDDLKAVLALLNDYNRSWFDGLSTPEREFRKEAVKAILEPKDEKASADGEWDKIGQQEALAKMSIERVLESFGGLRFEGKAVTPADDVEENGTFLVLGPAAYFASSETSASGIVEPTRRSKESDGGTLDAATLNRPRSSRVLPTPEKIAKTIRDAVTATSETAANLPFDPSLGKANVLANSEPTLLEELDKGGVWIFPILGFALLSTVIAIFKAFQIISIKKPLGQPSFTGNYDGPFASLRKAASRNRGKPAEILEEVLYEQIIEAQAHLEKLLPVVAVTAAAAPLLGLLGTVTGMIDVFQQLTHFANPENSELARGISEALVTTKFGLVTAIPALIAHALLSRRVQGIVAKLESFASGFVNLATDETTPTTDIPSPDESGN